MNDDAVVKIMQSLGLDYSPAIQSTIKFEKSIADLNKQLAQLKAIAIQSANDINKAFSSQFGMSANNKIIFDQFGKPLKIIKEEAKETSSHMKDMAKNISIVQLEQMKAQAAAIQQRVATKELSQEYGVQATTLRDQLNIIQARLQAEGKLTAEEVKQTQQLKEQLDILRHQTRAAVADDIREHPSTFGQEWERRSSWFLTGALFYGTINAAKEAQQTIKDVEMGMIEIARVMQDSSFVFDEYRDKLFQLGIQYGQTFDNVQQIALRWAQSGYNVADSLKLTETSLLALNTAELDATQATEAMIGIMSQWQLQAEDMALVMDKINITADRNSITSQDLVDGLLRASSAARIMNLSIDETIALLTVMREASGRTGREVGNALNSILSYIQRPSSINLLESMGIEMFEDEAKTRFRNVMEVFKDIEAQWDTASDTLKDGFVQAADDAGLFSEELAVALGLQEQFTDLQKRDIAQASAGVYRRNYYISMIERLNDTQKVLNDLMEAEGYAMRENAATMESLEKKQESLKASVERLAVAIGEAGAAGALKAMADGGTAAINAINDLPKPMRDLILATTSTFVAVKTLELGMKTFGIQLPGITQIIASLTSGTWSLTAALKAGATGIGAFVSANAPLLALSAAVGVIVAITNSIKKQREEAEKAIEVFNEQKDIYNEVNNLIPIYENLASTTALTAEENQKLTETKERLIELLPESKKFIDDENLSLEEQIDIIKDLNEVELDRLRINAQKVISDNSATYEKDKKRLEKIKDLYDENLQLLKDLQRIELRVLRGDETAFLTNEQMELLKALPIVLEDLKEEMDELETKTTAYEQALETLEMIMNDIGKTMDDTGDSASDLGGIVFDTTSAYEGLYKSIREATGDIKTLNQAIHDVKNGQSLSADTILDLVEKYHLSVDAIRETTDGYTVEIEALENLRGAKIKAAIDGAEAAMSDALAVKRQIESNIKNYGLEIEQLGNLVEVRKALSQDTGGWRQRVTANRAEEIGLEAAMLEAQEQHIREGLTLAREYNKVLDEIENIQKRSQFLQGLISDPYYGVSTSRKDKKYENKALDEALKLLEHRKRISEETQDTIKAEIAELHRITSLYVKTAEERMNMAERIYAAEKRLRDRTLQDSINWINERKSLGELSIEEEIAAWERVRKNQSDNAEAVKQATVNLYRLRNQLMTESYSQEENYIKHLTKLGILSAEEQIEKYRQLYQYKANSLQEEQARVENLFDLYKRLISDQQRTIKVAHDERISQIEEEAERRKQAQKQIIEGIEKELELLDKREQEYDHEKRMADLREQLAYWQVRTSEQARQKVAEITKQIEEEERKYAVELRRQELEEKKKLAQEEIDNIEARAKEEREKLEKAYNEIEIAFDEHSINMIALASTMWQGAYEEFEKNYLIPIQNALRNMDLDTVGSILSGVDDFAQDVFNRTYNTTNAQVYRLANQILEYKRQYEYGGDKSAAERAKPIYAELEKLNPSVAEALHRSNTKQAEEFIKSLPRMHTGGKTLSYGAVYMKPGELVFPPDLSIKLEGLIAALYHRPINQTSTITDNRKDVRIDTLLNIENNYMEDEVDSEILSRNLQRALASLI